MEDVSYNDAMMYATFYEQDNDGIWQIIRISTGHLSDYTIADNRQVLYKDKPLSTLLEEQTAAFEKSMQAERIWREEEKNNMCSKKRLDFLYGIT